MAAASAPTGRSMSRTGTGAPAAMVPTAQAVTYAPDRIGGSRFCDDCGVGMESEQGALRVEPAPQSPLGQRVRVERADDVRVRKVAEHRQHRRAPAPPGELVGDARHEAMAVLAL